MSLDSEQHWQAVYGTTASVDASWYEPVPQRSLELVRAARLSWDAAIVEIGGGASTLVDSLLASGFADVTVLDVAPAALEASIWSMAGRAE